METFTWFLQYASGLKRDRQTYRETERQTDRLQNDIVKGTVLGNADFKISL